jgi:hypothetical protein
MSFQSCIKHLVYLYWPFWNNGCSLKKMYSMKKSTGFVVVLLLWCLPPDWREAGSSFACDLKYTKWVMLTGMLTNTGNFRYIRHLFSENPKMYRKNMLDVHLIRLRWSRWRRQAGSRHFTLHKVELPELYILTANSYDISFVFHIRILLPSANGLFCLEFYNENLVLVYHRHPHSYMSFQWYCNMGDLLCYHHRHNYHHNISESHWFRISNCSESTSRHKLNVLEAVSNHGKMAALAGRWPLTSV